MSDSVSVSAVNHVELSVLYSATCTSAQFSCQHGACISRSLVCDGINDCPAGDDEATRMCGIACYYNCHCFGLSFQFQLLLSPLKAHS